MAILFPSHYPKLPNPNDPEFVVYQILKTLPDNYTVFYSKKFKGTGSWKEEGEVDFVIFDGSKTLLCMEVKGGRISYIGEEDCWFQNDKLLEPQPDQQATEGMRALIKFLYREGKDLNFGWILGFPNCSLPDDFQPPSRIPKQVIIDELKFTQIQSALLGAEQYYRDHYKKPGINSVTARSLVARLNRSVEFISKIGVRIAREHQQLIQITEDQFRVLEDLEINHRVAIRGSAGTGKTVLATEFARRQAEYGKEVLLLFYNRLIANTVHRSFDKGLPIYCTRFFKFARALIEEDDPTWWQQNVSQDERFWEFDVPLRLFEIPTENLPSYDTIIVDEGQDFRPDWYEFLEQLLGDPGESHFVVFYDEAQNIFGRWGHLPWGHTNAMRKNLKENCRNTKSIVSYVDEHYPTEMIPSQFSPEGVMVIEKIIENREDVLTNISDDIKGLLKQDVKPGEIVVLLNKPKRESCMADVRTIGKHKFESIGQYYNDRSRSIQFASLNMFKGLEANVVFLFLGGEVSEKEASELIYMEGTRARALLYVYILQFN
jgi:hypothetical protein